MLRLHNNGELGTSFPSLPLSLFLCLALSAQLFCVNQPMRDLPLPQFIHMDDLIHPQPLSDSLVKHTLAALWSISLHQHLNPDDSTHVRSCRKDFLTDTWWLYGAVLHVFHWLLQEHVGFCSYVRLKWTQLTFLNPECLHWRWKMNQDFLLKMTTKFCIPESLLDRWSWSRSGTKLLKMGKSYLMKVWNIINAAMLVALWGCTMAQWCWNANHRMLTCSQWQSLHADVKQE